MEHHSEHTASSLKMCHASWNSTAVDLRSMTTNWGAIASQGRRIKDKYAVIYCMKGAFRITRSFTSISHRMKVTLQAAQPIKTSSEMVWDPYITFLVPQPDVSRLD